MIGWLTNDPDAAAILRAADRRYARARARAKNLPLAEKVAAYARAKTERQVTYDSVTGC